MKWRPRFKRRSPWGRKRQTNRTYQDQYIRDLILADTAEMGGTCSVRSLTKHKPGRYHQRYLKAALDRMMSAGDLHRYSRGFHGNTVYESREHRREREAERRAA